MKKIKSIAFSLLRGAGGIIMDWNKLFVIKLGYKIKKNGMKPVKQKKNEKKVQHKKYLRINWLICWVCTWWMLKMNKTSEIITLQPMIVRTVAKGCFETFLQIVTMFFVFF